MRLVPGEAEDPRLYGERVSERPSAANGAVTLPDRVTVLTCIACGAMGREERCDGDCSEHKLVLVNAVDYDELLRAAHAARVRAARLASAVRPFADAHRGPATRATPFSSCATAPVGRCATADATNRAPTGPRRRR